MKWIVLFADMDFHALYCGPGKKNRPLETAEKEMEAVRGSTCKLSV